MAKQPLEERFLGGGLSFNQVGATAPPPDPAAGDTGPFRVPTQITARNRNTLLIVAALIVLMVTLYFVHDNGMGGVGTRQNSGAGTGSGRTFAPPSDVPK